jgi:glycosyltransferase involved in cell wall biosynthesis
MKISICIPQYNRIDFLVKSLKIIELQNYNNFEVIISDDCSTDNTENTILDFKKKSRCNIIYFRFDSNQGYDRNLRKSIELANGDYCLILGNDDTLNHVNVLSDLFTFLTTYNFPDIGFCNYCEFYNSKIITRRALKTGVIGTGPDIGLKYYSSFSFVSGLIFKKKTFDIFNTNRFDKSIYSQIALAFHMICNNAFLFSIDEVYIRKDITIFFDGIPKKSNSYLNFINRDWLSVKKVDAGLKSVINVLYKVLKDNHLISQKRLNYIFKKILFNTYPFWIIDYKYNKAFPESIGLYLGMQPTSIRHFYKLSFSLKLKYFFGYQFVSILAFLTPSKLFFRFKEDIYSWIKRKS